MNKDAVFDGLIESALAHPFSGWDFSVMKERWQQDEPIWDYPSLARQRMVGVERMLDQDTGGGELLASLAPLPPFTFATENYLPNIPIARERLMPLGGHVISEYHEEALPFGDNSLDLVLNRHGSYSVHELRRILRPGGIFLTQQVGGRDNLGLNELLQEEVEFAYSDWTLQKMVVELKHADLEIVHAQECFPENVFRDIGAVVFYLHIISWQVAGFTVDKYRQKLYAIHQRIQRDGGLVTHSHRILVEARKPA